MIGISIANSLGLNKLSGINPAAQAFLTAAGITGTTEVNAVNNLVNGLQADGLWSKMKAVYPFVTDNRNLASYTESFDNPYWVKFNSTVTPNTTTAPNGTTTADKLNENGAGYHTCSFATNLITSTNPYTVSFYAKASERTWCSAYLFDGTVYEAFFDLANGVIGSISSGMTATITSVGNGWYRCSATRSITVSASSNGGIITALGNNQSSYTGTGGNGIFIWGAQLELNSTATTYQPMIGSQQAYIAAQFKYNLVNPVDSDAAFRLVFNGGWTHSSNGALPNGTNGYADTKFNDSSLTPNSSHMSYYSRTNALTNTYDMGIYNGTKGVWFGIRSSATGVGLFTGGIYQAGASLEVATPNLDSTGYYIGGKNGNTTVNLYKNGTSVISGAKADTTATNTTIYLATLNQNGTPSFGFSTKQCAFSTIGDGLTSTEASNLYTRVQAFQTALSRNV